MGIVLYINDWICNNNMKKLLKKVLTIVIIYDNINITIET